MGGKGEKMDEREKEWIRKSIQKDPHLNKGRSRKREKTTWKKGSNTKII